MQKTKKLTQDHVSGLEDTLLTYRKLKPYFTKPIVLMLALTFGSMGILSLLFGFEIIEKFPNQESSILLCQILGYILVGGSIIGPCLMLFKSPKRKSKEREKIIKQKRKLRDSLTIDMRAPGFDIQKTEDVLEYIRLLDLGRYKQKIPLVQECIEAFQDLNIPISLEVTNESFEKRTLRYGDKEVTYEKVIF